jgi:hypothetical protein
LPPLIAQSEFTPADLPRAVALVLSISQGCYAFAPVLFGALRALGSNGSGGEAPVVFTAALVLQIGAIAALLMGIPRQSARPAIKSIVNS